MIKLSIIIVNWNTKELLRQCLKSLKVSSAEIIVVDNASTDGSREMIKKEFPSVRLIAPKENLKFAGGNNLGIFQARGKYIFLLNPDTLVKPGSLEKLVSFLDKQPTVVAVSPLLLNENETVQKDPCYLKFPSPLLVFFYYNPIFRKLLGNFFFSTLQFKRPSKVDQLPGAALMVRGELLKKINGFDEEFPHFFEDIDLSWRLSRYGQLFLLPSAEIIHFGGRSLLSVIEKEGKDYRLFLNFTGLFLFCRKHYPRWKSLLIKLIIFVQLLLTGKFSLIRKLT